MNAKTQKVIVILGPTASGKTNLSYQMLTKIPIEIISADSRQIYKYLNMGTAKPTENELNKCKHHFIDKLNPDEFYSAGIFADEAREEIRNIYQRGKVPVVVGGSGLYIKALFEGLFKDDDYETDLVEKKAKWSNTDRNALYEQLQKIDPLAANKYKDKNPVRLQRALDYYQATGNRISDSWEQGNKFEYEPIYFGINFPREILYQRINQRTEQMFENGIIKEFQQVLSMGFSQELNSLNTVGYKEVSAYLNGKFSLKEAVEETQKNTRRYAKRQITWFKKVEGIHWFDGENPYIADELLKICTNLKIFYK